MESQPITTFTSIAICPEETQEVTCQELRELGAAYVEPGYKAVYFQADLATTYKIHLSISTASRLLLLLRKGKAKNKKFIFYQAQKVRWPDIFSHQKTFKVEAIAGDRGPDAPSSNEISKQIRLAIQESFEHRDLPPPQVDLQEPQVTIVGFYWQKQLWLSVDTSGMSLHKRGYKNASHPAPLKEHLAAAALRMAGYDGSQSLFDPMCGSGSFVIEAAFMALNKSCSIHRKQRSFGLEHLQGFDRGVWRQVQDQLRTQKHTELTAAILAADIQPKYVAMTKDHALRARVERYLDIYQADFLEAPAPDCTPGILICNLPYGERLQHPEEGEHSLEAFYAAVGRTLKHNYHGWRAAVLVAEPAPWRALGLKPKMKRLINNGGIKCRLMVFELFAGKHKEHKQRTVSMAQP